MIDVKENNLRSKESLKRDDRQREKGEKEREKDKVASHSLFSPFCRIQPIGEEIIEKERERKSEREHSIHLNFSNYISCHARLQKVEWLQQPVSFSCRLP